MMAQHAEPAVSVTQFDVAFDRIVAACSSQAGAVLHVDLIDSPVGGLLVASQDDALILLQFTSPTSLDPQLLALLTRHDGCASREPDHVLLALRLQLTEYFAGRQHHFNIPLNYSGSAFQQQVWSVLRSIPWGARWSYLDVAREIGDLDATRAVGMANGQNPIAIVIPCHRVINANGDLGGFGGGLRRKQILLDLEAGQGSLPF